MSSWDVFHSDRLEVERGLSAADVVAAVARGDLHDDDLARPAGTSVPWARLLDVPELAAALAAGPAAAEVPPAAEPVEEEPEPIEEEPASVEEPQPLYAEPPSVMTAEPAEADDDEEPMTLTALIDDEDDDVDLAGDFDEPAMMPSIVAAPVADDELAEMNFGQDGEEYDPQDEDEEAAEFTLARGSAEKVEELDLAAMVDVAFQLVLFFLVTATTVLYKSLEVPKPNPESPPGAVAQGQPKSLNDLEADFILVEIDPSGAIKVDHEPAPGQMRALADRLRAARQATGRTTMLLSADFATLHKNAVLAYDAANEIGLRIAIARPVPLGPGQAPPPPPPAKGAG